MATSKKTSTKAKTKTASAKTPAKRTTKRTASNKTAAAKSTAKATSKVAAAKKTAPAKVTSAKRPRVLNVQKLRGLYGVAVGLFLALAVAAGTLMNEVSRQLTLGYSTKDELAGGMAPAVQGIYDVEIRWLVVATLVLAVVMPILYLTKLQDRYADYLNNTRMQPWRWVDFAVTGALITETVALLSGASDIPTLKLVGGLVVTTAVLGLIAERQNNTGEKPVRSAYYASLFTGALPLVFVAAYLLASIVYGTAPEWHVSALYGVLLASYFLQVRTMRAQLRGANYLTVERNYITTSILTKAAFAAILIVGLMRDF